MMLLQAITYQGTGGNARAFCQRGSSLQIVGSQSYKRKTQTESANYFRHGLMRAVPERDRSPVVELPKYLPRGLCRRVSAATIGPPRPRGGSRAGAAKPGVAPSLERA